MSWRLLPEVQRQWIQWPVRMDVPAPGGYQPITKYNTSLTSFHKFMQDRDRLDRFKALIETWVGPVKEVSPLDD